MACPPPPLQMSGCASGLVSLNVIGMTVFELLTQSQNDGDGPKIIFDTLYQTEFSTK